MTQQTAQTLFQQATQFDRSTLKERVATAERQRADIQRLFPLADWPSLALERYALGVRTDGGTYCHWLEFNSQELGGIGGGSALKHVVYKKKDGSGWYYPKEYADENQSWQAVRAEFNRALDLVRVGDLIAIDQLPNLGNKASLAKTLHIYFPNDILPIYSGAHLVYFLEHLSVPASQYELLGRIQQNRLLQTTLRARPEFDGWSNVEIAFFLYEVSRPGEPRFGAPFDKMFTDREEADWALDLIKDTARKLGVSDPDDPRWALTYRKIGGHHVLRVNYGSWATLNVEGGDGKVKQIMLVLFDGEYPDATPRSGTFQEPLNGKKARLYDFPVSVANPLRADLRAAFDTILEAMRLAFGKWTATTQKDAARKDAQRAVFNPSLRRDLLISGLKDEEPPPPPPEYSIEDCTLELCMDVDEVRAWVRHIERKRQAVLYGPPGTGKTFAARKLAKHLISGGDGFVELIQFHPAYAYEDFIQGLRPQAREGGGLDYQMVKGRFLEFCDRARTRTGRCVLIIDEFNRANLARVFGELMYLLEYREDEVPLAGGNKLSIPKNVVLIGTMNTADRSIALVDHALRRRFAFIALPPNFDALRTYHEKTGNGFKPDRLIEQIKRINTEIKDPNFALGVSFFMREDVAGMLPDIWRTEIEPYLEEYFFDRPKDVDALRWDAIGSQILGA